MQSQSFDVRVTVVNWDNDVNNPEGSVVKELLDKSSFCRLDNPVKLPEDNEVMPEV